MSFLPDWAPNAHPFIVHFPIALLVAAVLFDVAAQFFRNVRWPHLAATALYVLGVIAGLVALYTGNLAHDAVTVTQAAHEVMEEHEEAAGWLMWYFGAYALARIAAIRYTKTYRAAIAIPLVIAGVIGLFMLWETAEHGAELVYKYGVGVMGR